MSNRLAQDRASAAAVLPLLAATACWGVGTVVTKHVLDDVAPLTLLPMQLTASCGVLAVACLVRRERLTWSPSTRRLTGLGLLNPGLAYALGLLGLVSITASMSVLLWAVEPVLIILFAVALLRERVSGRLVVALTVAVAGVLLVVYQPGASGSTLGIALTLVAVACCALYTVATRRLLLDDASLPVVLAQQVAALVFAVLLATAVQISGGPGWSVADRASGTWIAAAASGCLYYGFAFWFFLSGLRHVDASVAGSFLPLIPVFGVTAALLVGEQLDPRQWLGALIVVAATAVMGVGTRRSRGVSPAKCPRRSSSPSL